ncbi:hypothetical protein C8R44DRAFT_855426 [Mycena epipterygia]|nr:hypothetical protein C8R44DRAFT_855426 [Mycena epipterygia]
MGKFADVASSNNGSSLNDSGSSLSLLLPSVPQIFHDRESELGRVADLLVQDSARVAILGPGGITLKLPGSQLQRGPRLRSLFASTDLPHVALLSILIRTSLAYIEAERLKVLAPLRLHWDELLLLWRTYQMPSGDLVPRLTGNVGNMTSLLTYGLEVGALDLKELFKITAESKPAANEAGTTRICRASHYLRVGEINKASVHADISLTLADKADNNLRRNRALCIASTCLRMKGKFREALSLARRALNHWLASKLGDFQRETEALKEEAQAWVSLGNFAQAIGISNRVRQLLIAADKFALYHGNSLAAIASIDVVLGVLHSRPIIAVLQIPRQIFTSRGYLREFPIMRRKFTKKFCDLFAGEATDFFSACMLRLGEINLLHDMRSATRWAVVNLANGKTTGSASILSWGLRLLGDIFRADGDDETSSTLFQIALEELNHMDIHLRKAECLLKLAEISLDGGEDGGPSRILRKRGANSSCQE